MTQPVPKGYHTLTPYLTVRDTPRLIEFLTHVFDAVLIEKLHRPDGTIMHAEVRIGDSMIMLSEACEQMGPMPAATYVYMTDADAIYKKALSAGAESIMEPADMFWGDRFSGVKDPTGNLWWIAQHMEDVAPDEIARRAQAFAEANSQQKA